MSPPDRGPGATVGLALCAAGTRLRGIAEEPRREARILLAHVTGRSIAALLADADAELLPGDQAAFDALVARRAAHVPVAQLTGEREFWSLPFLVTADTLIPRPESETLIEAALALQPDRGAVRRVLDLGTGTGCLLAAALTEFPDAWGLGLDRSAATAGVAARNLYALGLGARSSVVVGDWAAAVVARFDLVLGNPPYIPTGDVGALAPEVRDHEPRAALDGGSDGLRAYRTVVAQLPRLLAADGVAILEVGQGQALAVAELAEADGLRLLDIRADLAGVQRAVALGLAASGPGSI
jgi:release factor glutamine methyltransferase